MASNSYKNPPKFDESTSYETWKNEIEIWKLMTELPKKKQALAVSLSLGGTARQTALVCLFVCWTLTSLCHSNGHIETMPAREINPFTALTRIRSQFLRTQ